MKYSTIIFLSTLLLGSLAFGQEQVIKNTPNGPYEFSVEINHAATPVKSQGNSGTCWSFSTVSFLESELLRMGKEEVDFSEMFVVRKIYQDKANLYVRMHGKGQFSPGGTFHDVMNVVRHHGMMPQQAYPGKKVDPNKHNHGEMDAVLEGMLNSLIKRRTLTTKWKDALSGVLDAYLGPQPERMEVDGQEMTPADYASSLGINPDDYIELSSFTHQPYYKPFVLEIPDNWDWNQVYNLPLEEMMEVMTYALEKGYTVAWDGDVSEKGFMHGKSIAVVPANPAMVPGNDVVKEKVITAENRQEAFDNYKTTDDHLMHITGMAKDQKGTTYFVTKNSWGVNSNACGGYLYMSDAYVRYKTVHIMVHKDAVPKKILKKIGL
ncbi:MAG: C1 family peptidase [Bacteroidota bacterium]